MRLDNANSLWWCAWVGYGRFGIGVSGILLRWCGIAALKGCIGARVVAPISSSIGAIRAEWDIGMIRWLKRRWGAWRYRPDIEEMRWILSRHLSECDERGDEYVNRLYHWKPPTPAQPNRSRSEHPDCEAAERTIVMLRAALHRAIKAGILEDFASPSPIEQARMAMDASWYGDRGVSG